LHASEDVGTSAVSLGVEDFYGDKMGLACNAIVGSPGDTGDMGAMSIFIFID